MNFIRNIFFIILLAAAAAFLVFLQQKERNPDGGPAGRATEDDKVLQDTYERLTGCVLIPGSGNDGDSFRLAHDGRETVFRLYFVDTPETSERYPARVADQADYFGDLPIEAALRLGEQASETTRRLLTGKEFEVFTRWRPVMDSGRFYAFIRFPEHGDGEAEWLCQRLVDAGLARIHTWGDDLPSGESWREFRRMLEGRERKARRASRGGWALER